MSSILIRNVEASDKQAIQQIAAEEGISMEEKLRRMITREVAGRQEGLGTRISNHFKGLDYDHAAFERSLREMREESRKYVYSPVFDKE